MKLYLFCYVHYLTYSWRVMVFSTVRHGVASARHGNRHRNAMALHGIPRSGTVLHGNAMGVSWHCHGVPWCSTARFLVHAMKYTMTLPWYCPMVLPRNRPMAITMCHRTVHGNATVTHGNGVKCAWQSHDSPWQCHDNSMEYHDTPWQCQDGTWECHGDPWRCHGGSWQCHGRTMAMPWKRQLM